MTVVLSPRTKQRLVQDMTQALESGDVKVLDAAIDRLFEVARNARGQPAAPANVPEPKRNSL